MHKAMRATLKSKKHTVRPDDEILPGVTYGRPEWVPSPAFWAALVAQEGPDGDAYVSPPGTPLIEDVAFCILGGYGVKMEVNRAAFKRISESGMLNEGWEPKSEDIEALLRIPLDVAGRKVRYRFPRQKALRLAEAIRRVREFPPFSDDARACRDALMALPGVGPKTASWIVRNWRGSNEVAILDIHVMRAGQIIGLFPQDARLPRDYGVLESRFLEFAEALDVPASLLDAIMWREMRVLTR
ncbi:MAG: hypothetical protein RIC52_04490 [Amphiplicatus sp.]